MSTLPPAVETLLRHGVTMPAPHTVEVAREVLPESIAPGATIHAGCRIRGADTAIGPGCVIGEEAPATVDNCQLGRGVALAGGFFSGATFLDGVSFGSGAHVRPGTLLEEQASCAHSVGLKQTLLMPFVVTGSLVNFCDCLMAGGTSRRDHSEVGSSYIHFNFTPHGDKATASLIGDVPHGVRLDQRPIFLGGQGGLVGPARIAYGTVIAAGTVWRRDVREPGRLAIAAAPHADRTVEYDAVRFADLSRVVANNVSYIGNLHALILWYSHVRTPFLNGDSLRRALLDGALRQLNAMVAERIKRMDELVARLNEVAAADLTAYNRNLRGKWPSIADGIRALAGKDHAPALRDEFLRQRGRVDGDDYLAAIRSLTPDVRTAATTWLQAEVDTVTATCPGA